MGLIPSKLDDIDCLENYMRSCYQIKTLYTGKMDSAFNVPCCSLVYVLILENGKYYVGFSNQVNLRIAAHFSGEGSRWTKLHKPIGIHKVCLGGRDVESRVTLETMVEFGWENVRGAGWCRPVMRSPPLNFGSFMNSRKAELKLVVMDTAPRPTYSFE